MATIDPQEEHQFRSNLEDYRVKLLHGDDVLPDPFVLKEGWLAEENRTAWPSIYMTDIADLMRMTTTSELYHRLCNEYKQGKAYR